jgi:protein-S-isoprenylcysteine O-methyltransferase Ste14
MIESIFVTIFPVLFLILLFGGKKLFHNKDVDLDGKPPINKTLFISSKYLIVLMWICAVIQSWGVNLSTIYLPVWIIFFSLFLWFLGFAILFIGRFELGNSFRIGEPKENTHLKTAGLFKFSRNPMYVGVYITILATILYTANIVLLIIGIFIIAVHHKIVLSEEKYLKQKFGDEYKIYSTKVRRYI